MSEELEKKIAELLKSAQHGDRRALDLLCRELENIIRGFFWKKFQNKTLVDDLTQETYLRFYHNFSNVKEPMKLRSFVIKIAVHVSHDYFRQKYRLQEEPLELQTDPNEEVAIKGDKPMEKEKLSDAILDRVDVEKALEQLSQKSRQILFMKINGYKYQDIAKQVGITVSGVKMQVQRSLEQLRELLGYVTFLAMLTTFLLEKMGS
jgi:RNA polymerase sigma-70 factor (ECF subfamily)